MPLAILTQLSSSPQTFERKLAMHSTSMHAVSGLAISCFVSCRMFLLARERDLDLDFHVDGNGIHKTTGLLQVASKTLRHGFQGRVVCGPCW